MMDYQDHLVSIIVVNWNTKKLVLQCLRSIISTSSGECCCEIIVVDNASSDGSAGAIAAEFPDIKLIALESNVGFAAGNNIGLHHAAGVYVLFLNPDTIVMDGAVEQMLRFLLENPGAGAVGCRLLNSDGSTQTSAWDRYPDLAWLVRHSLYLDKLSAWRRRASHHRSQGPQQVAHLLGACIMAPIALIRSIGGFDESYFLYLEETDLCRRIVGAGHSIWHIPWVEIIHIGQQSSNQAAEWANSELTFNLYRFVRRYSTPGVLSSARLIRFVLAAGVLVRLILWSVRFVLMSRRRALARRMLNGYWRSLRGIPSLEKRCVSEGLGSQPGVPTLPRA